jgi:predicted dehydrogenase
MAIGSAPRGMVDGRPAPAYTHVDGYRDHPATEVVAICDLDPAALDRYCEFHGDGDEVARYTNSDEMLRREQLDLVSIVTPDNRHHRIFAAAADSGVRGILCEKPIATSLEDAGVIIDAVKRTGVKTLINHSRRFDNRHRQVKHELEAGRIGPVHHAVGVLGGPRAMLFRNGTHLVNTLMYYLGSTPIWVQAAYADADASYGVGYRGDGGRDPDLEPAVVATIGFANGSRGVFNSSKQIASIFEVTTYGATGSVTIGNSDGEWRHQVEGLGTVRRQMPALIHSRPPIVNAIDDLIGLIEHDGDCLPEVEAARTTLAVLLSITESAANDGLRVEV